MALAHQQPARPAVQPSAPRTTEHQLAVTGIVFNVQRFSIHDGPGIRTTVFLKGCPLRCPWCANPESQRGQVEQAADGSSYGEEKTVAQVLATVLRDRDFYEQSGGGATLSGGEPLLQKDFALALLMCLREENIHTAVETTGAVDAHTFAQAVEAVDYLLFDIKHHDPQKHAEAVGGSLPPILANLRRALASKKELLVRIPVIPGYNSALADARAFAALLAGLGVARVEALPFHQFGESKYQRLGRAYALAGVPALHEEDLAAYKQVLREGGLDVV